MRARLMRRLRRLTAPRWDLGQIDLRQDRFLHVFRTLAKSGLGPANRLEVQHTFYVTSEASAERVRSIFEGQGYETSGPLKLDAPEPGEGPQEWEIEASRVERLSIAGMRSVVAEFESLMLAEGGDYDGWHVKSSQLRVFVRLHGEGIDVWGSVPCEDLGDGRVRILPTDDYDPATHAWQFPPGSIVECEPFGFARRVAKGAVSSTDGSAQA